MEGATSQNHPENKDNDKYGSVPSSEESNSDVFEEDLAKHDHCCGDQVLREVFALKDAISSRDTLLKKLEESVTRLAEDFRTLKQFEMAKEQEVVRLENFTLLERSAQNGSSNAEEIKRRNCIKALMKMTTIIESSDTRRRSSIQAVYEEIYDKSQLTSSILIYLQSHPEVQILIDCDTSGIHRIVKRIHNFDGEKEVGQKVQSFADFFKHKVYSAMQPLTYDRITNSQSRRLSGRPIAALAQSLVQMVMHLIFKNGGSPYLCNDDMSERLYEQIISEIIRKGSVVILDEFILLALDSKTTLGKEIKVASLIPGIVVNYGIQHGLMKITDQLPWLYLFYKQNILPKMMIQSEMHDS